MNKNKVLIIVFGVLVLIYLGNRFIGSDNERNFKSELVSLDTAAVTKVVVMAKANDAKPVTLSKENNQWSVSNGAMSDKADQRIANNMLVSLRQLNPQRLVANSSKKWSQYEVNDSLGTRVQIYSGEELLSDLMIGKFTFNQQARTAATFVRLSNEEEVYTVDGFLSSTFNQDFNGFRDKTFINTVPDNLTSLKFAYPGDSSFSLSKVSDKWQMNGVSVDSTAVIRYLNGLRKLDQSEFEDDFKASQAPVYTLTIDGNNMNSIVVKGFRKDDEIILNSTLNPDAYFKEGNLNVFEKVFVSLAIFKSIN